MVLRPIRYSANPRGYPPKRSALEAMTRNSKIVIVNYENRFHGLVVSTVRVDQKISIQASSEPRVALSPSDFISHGSFTFKMVASVLSIASAV